MRAGTAAEQPDFRFVGSDLQRPECVLAGASGRLYASDRRGGVTCIEPDGTQRLIGRSALVPNGIALRRDGSFLVANMSDAGGVWQIDAGGRIEPWLMEVDGVALPKVNFVSVDAQDRAWVCVSARDTGDAYPLQVKSGFIVLVERGVARVVADGLHYTNECRLAATGEHLLVNETFGRCVTRFALRADGSLHRRERIASFSDGDFPDGLALDAEGGVWVVCVGSNRVYRVTPQGLVQTIIDDSVPETTAALEAAYQAGTLTRPMLSGATGRSLQNISSLAFGGPDLRTAVLGCLNGTALASFTAPMAGLPPAHWHWV